MTSLLLTFVGCFVACGVLTYFVRQHAITRRILDYPNERSSHVTTTPRGGGLAIAISLLSATLLSAVLHLVDIPLTVAVVGGGSAIAIIGWMDDLGKAPVALRLVVQLLAAAGAVIALGGMEHPIFSVAPVDLGVAGSLLAILGIVWCTNLYNFMDGIDGLAASEATIVAGMGATITALGDQAGVSIVLAALAGAASAFLLWNWQPARIFMGDVGSGLIGFILGICVVATQHGRPIAIIFWLILLLVFFVDATVTLLRRIHAREALHIAHRSHAYQRAVQAGWSHQRVTLLILVINLALGTLALTMWRRPTLTAPALIAALTIVGFAYWMVERVQSMYPRTSID